MIADIAKLRRWAAEVCGYEPKERDGHLWVTVETDGDIYACPWKPDVSISQSFEVLDVVCNMFRDKTMPAHNWMAWNIECESGERTFYRCDISHSCNYVRGEESESLCLTILSACRQAHEAMKEKEHA